MSLLYCSLNLFTLVTLCRLRGVGRLIALGRGLTAGDWRSRLLLSQVADLRILILQQVSVLKWIRFVGYLHEGPTSDFGPVVAWLVLHKQAMLL